MKTQPTDAQCGIRLGRLWQRRQRLVGANVERAEDDRAIAHRGYHLFQHRHLLILVRQLIAAEKQELAAQQANSIRAGRGGPAGIIQVGGIAADLDAPAIAGRSRLGIGRQRRRPADAGHVLGRRVDDEEAAITVE